MRVEFLTFPNQVVSDVSVRRVVPLVFTFVVLFSEMSVLWPMDATVFIQGAAQGVPRVPFLQFWPSPGLHFGSSGDPLVSIFPVLGVSWAAFWEPWGPFGLHFGQIGDLWGALGVPMPPRPPKTEFSQIFPSLFGGILDRF